MDDRRNVNREPGRDWIYQKLRRYAFPADSDIESLGYPPIVEGKDGDRIHYLLQNSRRFIRDWSNQSNPGGIAWVYCATDLADGTQCAVKALRTDFAKNPDEEEFEKSVAFRMISEGEVLQILNHPNIVHLHFIGVEKMREDGRPLPFLVMEYINGRNGNVIDFRRWKSPEFIHFLAGIASALDYVHFLNLVHADVKPSNMMEQLGVKTRGFNFSSMLVDFGRVRNNEPGGSEYVWGAPGYMSPSVVRGNECEIKDDNWAFVASIFKMCTGRLPYGLADTPRETKNRVKDPKNLQKLVKMRDMVRKYGENRCRLLDNFFNRMLNFNEVEIWTCGSVVEELADILVK